MVYKHSINNKYKKPLVSILLSKALNLEIALQQTRSSQLWLKLVSWENLESL